MLTRALFALALICGLAGAASAEETKVLALGLADHEVTQDGAGEGRNPATRRISTPRRSPMCLAADLKKGDMVEITLINDDQALLSNSETLAEDKATFLLQAGKRGVPAGGWPEGSYRAALKITRDGKTLIEQSEPTPIPFRLAGDVRPRGGRTRASCSKAVDGVGLLQRQPDIVETFHQAALAERVDVELDHAAVGASDLLRFEVDGQHARWRPARRRRSACRSRPAAG